MSYTYNPGNITLNTAGGIAGSGTSTITLTSGAGTTGQYFTTGAGTTSWASPTTNFNDGNHPVMTIPHNSKTIEIDKAATLDVKGNVKINGIDLEERLKTIEKVLQIPERDVKLEKKHPKLKKLYDEYIAALGKYRTFEAIKGEDE
jgi:hypothetical protein